MCDVHMVRLQDLGAAIFLMILHVLFRKTRSDGGCSCISGRLVGARVHDRQGGGSCAGSPHHDL
jgi:hypothetical protein